MTRFKTTLQNIILGTILVLGIPLALILLALMWLFADDPNEPIGWPHKTGRRD